MRPADNTTEPAAALPAIDPAPALLARVAEAGFDPRRPTRLSRAPGRLDVMGGIADYTGSMVLEFPLACAAAVATQQRDDRLVHVASFDLPERGKRVSFGIALDQLAQDSDALRAILRDRSAKWAGYLLGCLHVLHEQTHIDLNDPATKGLNVAVHSTVPLGAGVSSSAAVEVATMINLAAHFDLLPNRKSPFGSAQGRQIENRKSIDPMRLAALCQRAEHRIV